MLNNFGAAGSNGALLLEEYVDAASETLVQEAATSFVVGLSAKSAEALNALRDRYVEWLNGPSSESESLSDIAYTATARRRLYDYRLAVTAGSKAELAEKLKSASGAKVSGGSSKVAFVFSGQGGQYLGMGSALYKTVPAFRSVVDECHDLLTKAGFPGITPIINAEGDKSGMTQIEEFEANQAAIFVLEYGLAKLWMSWGVKPEVVVGHRLVLFFIIDAGFVDIRACHL